MKFVTDSAALSDRLVLPIDGLSEETQAIIEGYAKGYQCNRDIITAAVFMAASTAIGKRACTDDGRYKNYFPFFICVVAPSGSNKSTPMREVLRPLSERNAANYEAFREEMKQYEMEVKAGDENAEKPRFRQLIISDSTPESRTKALMENPNVLLVSDEIATMLYNLNRYNRSGEVPQLLSVWSMDDVIINRKSEMPQLIREPFLSIIGGTQPDVLADTFGSDYFMSSGFNQRWLFVYPDDEPPAMYSESYVSTEISEAWRGFINVLLDDTFVAGGTVTLFIRGEAKQCYIDYYDQLQRKKADADGYMRALRIYHWVLNPTFWEQPISESNYPFGEIIHWTRPMDIIWLINTLPYMLMGINDLKELIFLGGALLSPWLYVLSSIALIYGLRRRFNIYLCLLGCFCLLFLQLRFLGNLLL